MNIEIFSQKMAPQHFECSIITWISHRYQILTLADYRIEIEGILMEYFLMPDFNFGLLAEDNDLFEYLLVFCENISNRCEYRIFTPFIILTFPLSAMHFCLS